MNDINILILSAGRRVELVKRFIKAKEKLRIKGNVVAVDISDTAPAMYFADKYYLIPRIDSDEYINSVIDVCKKEEISLIIPTIDTELLKLSENRNRIEKETSAKILLSRDEVIRVCRDKKNTQRFFEENGFGVPEMISNEDIKNGNYTFPLFIKPLDGSSSINTFKLTNKEELDFFIKYIKKPMIQKFITGEEYSVDVFCDFESKPITIVPRRRIATRGGEIAKGQILRDCEIINDVKRMLDILKPIGHITIQLMKTEKGIEYIEINPRFGGGAPMSIDAGADSCENIYHLLMGESLCYNENYKDKALFVRFDSSIMINKDKE